MDLYGVIMAGGGGSRFWPLSRQALPKQFLQLLSDESMLIATAKRCNKFIKPTNMFLATVERYSFLVQQSLPWLKSENLILEPCNRDTAPCIAYALQKIMKRNPEAVVFFLPSDHHVGANEAFVQDMYRAAAIAESSDKIVTIGILPTYPANCYGYLECGNSQGDYYECNRFVEKPDFEQAQTLVESGNYLWNSGIFVAKAKNLWAQIKEHQPEIITLLSKGKDFEQAYSQMPRISLDFGVMEKLSPGEVLVLPASFDWDDIGSFTALGKYWQGDNACNFHSQDTRLVAMDSQGSLVTRDGGIVALLGVDNLLVVEHDGVLLIADKNRDQEIKRLVDYIASQGANEYL